MKNFTGEIESSQVVIEPIIPGKQGDAQEIYAAYIGLDVHKETIAVAIAEPGRKAPESYGEIANKPKSIEKLLKKLAARYHGQPLLYCYEAGPCGYVIHRQITQSGFDCQVIAPSKIPSHAGERIKTDKRDALKLAKYLRNGDLTAIWVPERDQEAMRDLTRIRGDMKGMEQKARQQLNAFVLRHGHHWPGNRTRWTKTHYNWLENLKFEQPYLQIVLQEYIDSARAATVRVEEIGKQMEVACKDWVLGAVVDSLVALRGIDRLAAMVILAELGDVRRFESPKQLMAYLGLVPSEHSSGKRRRQGSITLTGNGHARRMLVECAWSYRFPARQTAHLKRKAISASVEAKKIAWTAQKRLCGRYKHLVSAGKSTKTTCVAIARELVGFIWDIVRIELNATKA